MNKRISTLVAIGFTLLIALGAFTSVALIKGLGATVTRSQASHATTLDVRASVRSLRADYLRRGDAVSQLLLDPSRSEAREARRAASTSADDHLRTAESATGRDDLRTLLARLRTHDQQVTSGIEDALLMLVATDLGRAKEVYFEQYLPARKANMELVDRALEVASEEAATASRYVDTTAARTQSYAWLAVGLFVLLGAAAGMGLSRAVGTIARDFEGAAQEVWRQRDHMQAVMTAMRDALMVVDDGTIRMVNQAACALLGYTESELIGSPLGRCVREAREIGWAGTAEHHDRRVTYVTRGGDEVSMSLSVAPMREPDGSVHGTVWVARDMRPHLMMLAEVEAARDAALEVSRLKSEFLANMSHEMRTPMNAVIGYTDIALETDLAAEQREYLAAVKRAAVGLLAVVNDVLDVARIEGGKLTLDRVAFKLRETVRDVLKTLALRADEKGLELASDVGTEVPDGVVGDPNRLRQVLVNLVGNAVKFTETGEVVVRVRLESYVADRAALLRFAVADTGIGIPADKQGLIFHAFAQADGSMSRTYGGTGLGLSIATQLVEMMGGRIWVESEVGQGSVFQFTVRVGLQENDAAWLPSTLPALRGCRVLVVDRNATVRGVLVEMLRAWQMEPLAAEDGATGLAALRRARRAGTPYALVLVDARLPEADGFGLAERILEDPELRGPRVILLTASTRPGDVARARKIGVAGCLIKPLMPSDLLDGMTAALGLGQRGELPHDVASQRPPLRPLRLLLVEDDTLSRRMMSLMLETAGHTVVGVEDGRQALAAVQRETFDVVLMDVQMPVMDGFATTAALRAWERSRGTRVPIVAVTAHAMKGDRERCLRSGMDAYVTKPVEPQELFAVLEQVVSTRADTERPPAPSAEDPEVLDAEALLRRVNGNQAAVAEIIAVFRADSGEMLRAIDAALSAWDAEALARAAHRLKGALMTLAAPAASRAALRLEDIARERDLRLAADARAALARVLARLEPQLDALAPESVTLQSYRSTI